MGRQGRANGRLRVDPHTANAGKRSRASRGELLSAPRVVRRRYSAPARPGERGARIPAAVLDELRTTWSDDYLNHGRVKMRRQTATARGRQQQTAADGSGRRRDMAAADGRQGMSLEPLTGSSHDVSPAAAILAAVERKRDSLAQQLVFLQAQLDRRAGEAQARPRRRSSSGSCWSRLEQTNAQLAATLVQKALPPGVRGRAAEGGALVEEVMGPLKPPAEAFSGTSKERVVSKGRC